MLKILAGEARGRILKTPPKSPDLRPILARVKQSLFDIIRLKIPQSRFLDLYAGTGAVGLEALSRGSTTCAFVERDRQYIKILHENIERLNYKEKASVFSRNASQNLTGLPGPYDIIFMGPPYKDAAKAPLTLVSPTLLHIEQAHLLGDKGIIVAQHHKNEKIEVPSGHLKIIREEPYGDTRLSFLKMT